MGRLPLKKMDLLIGTIVAVLYICLSLGTFDTFESIEKVIYGIEMRLDVPENLGASRIAIVNIDEKSFQRLGSWPWPRHIIAEMISILKGNGAKLIGLELLFGEEEQSQGLRERKSRNCDISSRASAAFEPKGGFYVNKCESLISEPGLVASILIRKLSVLRGPVFAVQTLPMGMC